MEQNELTNQNDEGHGFIECYKSFIFQLRKLIKEICLIRNISKFIGIISTDQFVS